MHHILLEQELEAEKRQVGGDHYLKMKIQPLEFSMENNLNACQHTAIKYITRHSIYSNRKKHEEDIEKAIHTLQLYKKIISK